MKVAKKKNFNESTILHKFLYRIIEYNSKAQDEIQWYNFIEENINNWIN